jgi:hypothetical protein
MRSVRAPWILVLTTLLGCHRGSAKQPQRIQPAEDRIEQVEAASYHGPPLPHIRLAPGTVTGAVVGAVFGCDGEPLPDVQVKAWQPSDSGRGTDTLLQLHDTTFTLRFLEPGDWLLDFRFIAHQARVLPVTIQAGVVDTLMVQLSMTSLGVRGDCVCANGRDFGGQCCKGVTIRVCTPNEPKKEHGSRSEARQAR